MALDGKQFGQELCALLKDYVRRQIEPLTHRITELESRPPMEYRGIWGKENVYRSGDAITYAGSSWIAFSANSGARPGSSPAWDALGTSRPGIAPTRTAAARQRPVTPVRKEIVRKTK